MRKRVSRIAVIAAMTLSGSYLFASGNLACGSMGSEAGIGTADMCFIFDCTNGAFGGLLDPCADVAGSDTGNPDQGGRTPVRALDRSLQTAPPTTVRELRPRCQPGYPGDSKENNHYE